MYILYGFHVVRMYSSHALRARVLGLPVSGSGMYKPRIFHCLLYRAA